MHGKRRPTRWGWFCSLCPPHMVWSMPEARAIEAALDHAETPGPHEVYLLVEADRVAAYRRALKARSRARGAKA